MGGLLVSAGSRPGRGHCYCQVLGQDSTLQRPSPPMQVYKRVRGEFNAGDNPTTGYQPIQRGEELPLVASHYRN